MRVSRTLSGDIFIGEVVKTKPGSGSASDILTILTLKDQYRKVKVLCWNSEYDNGRKLSDQARKLKRGDMVSIRAEFDIGDENKCTALEIKTSGIYNVVEYGKGPVQILLGEVKETKQTKEGIFAFVPSYQTENGKFGIRWNCVWFLNSTKEFSQAKRLVRKGKSVCVYFSELNFKTSDSVKHGIGTMLFAAE